MTALAVSEGTFVTIYQHDTWHGLECTFYGPFFIDDIRKADCHFKNDSLSSLRVGNLHDDSNFRF